MRRVGTAWYLMQHGMVFRHWVPLPRPRRLHGAVRPPARPPSDRSYAPTAPGSACEEIAIVSSRLYACTHARVAGGSAAAPPPVLPGFQASGNAVSFRPVDRSIGFGRATAHGRQRASSTARVAAARAPARAPKQRCMSYANVCVVSPLCATHAHRLRAGLAGRGKRRLQTHLG